MQNPHTNPRSLPVKPYGSWPSDFSADSLASGGKRLGDIRTDNDDIYWLESRPAEKGRMTLMRKSGNVTEELLSAPFNIRSSVHEYGGAAFTVHLGTVYFVNHVDKEIYILPAGHETPARLTNEPDVRYADLQVDVNRNRLIFVREDHRGKGHEPENTIGFVSLDTRDAETGILARGADFYASPAISPDG
ncbi:MAG: S9 family peptidase, partial [Calditrichota bacterium]